MSCHPNIYIEECFLCNKDYVEYAGYLIFLPLQKPIFEDVALGWRLVQWH